MLRRHVDWRFRGTIEVWEELCRVHKLMSQQPQPQPEPQPFQGFSSPINFGAGREADTEFSNATAPPPIKQMKTDESVVSEEANNISSC